MEERVVWRYRAAGPMEMVTEVVLANDQLLYRRLFEGEVVVEESISPEAAGLLWAGLVRQGWHLE